jgi:hypothetical protein
MYSPYGVLRKAWEAPEVLRRRESYAQLQAWMLSYDHFIDGEAGT